MKKVSNVFFVMAIIVLAWGVISWVDIFAHNLSPNPQYLPFNLLVLIFG